MARIGQIFRKQGSDAVGLGFKKCKKPTKRGSKRWNPENEAQKRETSKAQGSKKQESSSESGAQIHDSKAWNRESKAWNIKARLANMKTKLRNAKSQGFFSEADKARHL